MTRPSLPSTVIAVLRHVRPEHQLVIIPIRELGVLAVHGLGLGRSSTHAYRASTHEKA